MRRDPVIAIVVYNGVLIDETEIFRFVLSRIPGFTTITVGVAAGEVCGPGGAETADVSLGDVLNPEIVALPGGIGSHRRTEIATWVRHISPAWILTSSTGSALLATTGLLHDTAATHWLAGPLLERYGVHPSDEQVIIDNGIVTTSGRSSAFHGALVVAQAYGGPKLVDQIRVDTATIDERPPSAHGRSWWRRLGALARRSSDDPNIPSQRPADIADLASDDPDVLDLGLITPPKRR